MRRSRPLAASLLAAALLGGCGGEPPPTPTPAPTPGPTGPVVTPSPTRLPPAVLNADMTAEQLFDDQTGADELELVERSREPRDQAIVRDVRFTGADGEDVAAYLVGPASGAATAGIVFLHWLGEDFSNREEFVGEAVELAASGVESMLITQVFPWTDRPSGVEHDRVSIGLQVRTIRRAITLLAEEVKPGHVALVGHDYGAMHGILAASVETRLVGVVGMAPDATWVSWFVTYFHLEPDGYAQAMADVDPVTRIAGITVPVVLQFGTADTFVPTATVQGLTGAAPGGTEVHAYDAGHRLDSEARADRDAWLLEVLGVRVPRPS